MTHSPLTNGIQLTSDSSPRESSSDRFIVHHAATTSLGAILSLFQPGGRTVSANYALGNDGTLILAVDEDRRAWTSSSSYWDGRAVTIECANSVAGDNWPVSDATFDKLARLIADVSIRYGFPINDDTVLTHQELYIRYGDSYATACPGDLQRRKGELLASALAYRNGAFNNPKPKPIIQQEADMPIVVWNTNTGGIYTLATQYIRHEVSAPGFGGANGGSTAGLQPSGANYVVNVTSPEDKYISATTAQFNDLLDSFGIPREVIGANGHIIPAGGTEAVRGGKWSATDAVLVALKG